MGGLKPGKSAARLAAVQDRPGATMFIFGPLRNERLYHSRKRIFFNKIL
jgi:hypothetical protein